MAGREGGIGPSDPGRITKFGSGIVGTALNASGGSQNNTLAANQIPSLTSTGSRSETHSYLFPTVDAAEVQSGSGTSLSRITGSHSLTSGGPSITAISTTYTNGSQATVNNMRPTLLPNCFVRVLP